MWLLRGRIGRRRQLECWLPRVHAAELDRGAPVHLDRLADVELCHLFLVLDAFLCPLLVDL
jgi:hypothetical protein